MRDPQNPNMISFVSRPDRTLLGLDEEDSELQVGMALKNRFVLEQVLGQGGMGAIFKARDLRKEEMNDRKIYVAIKLLHPKFRSNDSLIKALQREARKSQELAHPNIVNVHDFDRDGRHVFMVMEYLEGCTLNELIEIDGISQMNLDQRWHLIESIAYGLAYAHQKKVIHYDIKPANIFICDDNNVKILDFGIAKAMRATPEENYTVFDQFSPDALTPAYATIEMLRWEPPDLRDDVYALGCVAYEILTGKHPFNRQPSLRASESGLKPKRIKGLSKAKWQVLKSALQLERTQRLTNVEAFLGKGHESQTNRVSTILLGLIGVFAISGVIFAYFTGTWKIDKDLKNFGFAHQPHSERSPKRPNLSPEEQAKVDRLMNIAKLHASIGRVVEPLGSSALDAYASALEIDPGLAEARRGIANAIATCRKDVGKLMQDGELEIADDIVHHCLLIKPHDPVLSQLNRNLQVLIHDSQDEK